MKVKMLEYFQGSGQPTLILGEEYEVDAKLGAWLVENGKAQEIKPPPPPPPPPEPEPEPVIEEAQAETPETGAQKPAKRARSARRGSTKK